MSYCNHIPKLKVKETIAWLLLMLFFITQPAFAQRITLSGTRWNVTVASISNKPYSFIFGDSGNKGNVLYPDSTLCDFTWAEDSNGNWSITVERLVNGIKKTETFYGKITGKTGTGFYANTADIKNLKPLIMSKK